MDKILIPLDGLDLSEEAIPYGEQLAKMAGSELILFHVCEHDHKGVYRVHNKYLKRVADDIGKRIEKDSLNPVKPNVNAVQLTGDFIQELCRYVARENVDLVIMATYDADLKERAQRRFKELIGSGAKITIEDVEHDAQKRDISDQTRKVGALKKAKDALIINTTNMTIEEVVKRIVREINI